MVFNTEKKVPTRVFIALVAIFGAAACEKIGLKNGDQGTVVRQTTCWRYPGGEHASRLEAPLGQENHGLINEGAKATVTIDKETEMFGATSAFGTSVRVEINGEEITPSKGIIATMAEEQGITVSPDLKRENQVCWIKSTDFAPTNK